MGVTAGSGRPIRAWEVLVVEGLQELGLYIGPQERQQDGPARGTARVLLLKPL